MKLNFTGTGSAFNLEKRETSAFIVDSYNLILIDCGNTVYSDGYIAGIIEDANIYNVTILITHTHPDHIGGLGAFVMWLYYCRNIVPNICYGSRLGNESVIRNFLSIQGIAGTMYNWVQLCGKVNTELYGRYLVKSIKTNHKLGMESSAYIITDKKDDYSIFYSGDLNELPGLDYSKFDDIYIECTKNPNFIMHLNLDILSKVMNTFKDNIYIMHYEKDDISAIICAGFKLAKNVWERDMLYELND